MRLSALQHRLGWLSHIIFAQFVWALTAISCQKQKRHYTFNACFRQSEIAEEFDGVMMCSGHHSVPYFGKIAGLDQFAGDVVHSYKYKHSRGYEDKNVVVVGIGNSGGDIAVELSYVANQVHLVSRSGTWVYTRSTLFGLPADCLYFSRMAHLFYRFCRKIPQFMARHVLNGNFDHQLYGLQPDYPPFSSHPFINDNLPNQILSGRVGVKPDINGIEKRRVLFADGTHVDDVDCIIVCTGFSIDFPYLEKGVLYLEDNKVHLFRNMYPPDLQHPTLALIGLIQPHGAILPISEMQARVFTHVLNGEARLPSRESMKCDIADVDSYNENRFYSSRRHTIQVDYIPFCDGLAELIGANVPPLYKWLLSDPKLAYASYMASGAPYQYRLFGPNSWLPARDHMLTVWDRVYAPLLPKSLHNCKLPNGAWRVFRSGLVGGIIVATFVAAMFWLLFQLITAVML